MVLIIRATASEPRAATPVVMTAWPSGSFRRNSSLSTRMRLLVIFMVCLDAGIGGGGTLGPQRTARAAVTRSGADWGWLQQRDGLGGAHDVWLLIVTPFQGQYVAVAGEDNRLPPALNRAFVGDHQMADGNVVPGG